MLIEWNTLQNTFYHIGKFKKKKSYAYLLKELLKYFFFVKIYKPDLNYNKEKKFEKQQKSKKFTYKNSISYPCVNMQFLSCVDELKVCSLN